MAAKVRSRGPQAFGPCRSRPYVDATGESGRPLRWSASRPGKGDDYDVVTAPGKFTRERACVEGKLTDWRRKDAVDGLEDAHHTILSSLDSVPRVPELMTAASRVPRIRTRAIAWQETPIQPR